MSTMQSTLPLNAYIEAINYDYVSKFISPLDFQRMEQLCLDALPFADELADVKYEMAENMVDFITPKRKCNRFSKRFSYDATYAYVCAVAQEVEKIAMINEV